MVISYMNNNAIIVGTGGSPVTSAQTAAFGNPNGVGNTIIVWATHLDDNEYFTSCVDTLGNTYTLIFAFSNGAGVVMGMFYARVTNPGSGNQITVSTVSGHIAFTVYAEEWNGIAAVSPVDAIGSITVFPANNTGSTNITTLTPNDLVVAGTCWQSAHSASVVGSGYTSNSATALDAIGAEYQLVTTPGTYGAGLSWTTNAVVNILAVAFKQALPSSAECDGFISMSY